MLSTLQDIYSIKAIGVGEAGNSAIKQMIGAGLKGLEFCAVDTAPRGFGLSQAPDNSQFGKRSDKGLTIFGPPADESLAQENATRIGKYMQGADLIFLIGGMGENSGTDALPEIARIARERGIFTVAMVIKPISSPGRGCFLNAAQSMAGLKQLVDNSLVLSVDRALQIIDNPSAAEAYRLAQEVLTQIMQGISDLTALPNLINFGLNKDIKPILRGDSLYMGTGSGSGQESAVIAARQAVANPLIETALKGATAVFMNITGGSSLDIFQTQQAVEVINAHVDPAAQFGLGAAIDGSMEDKIRITVIASK